MLSVVLWLYVLDRILPQLVLAQIVDVQGLASVRHDRLLLFSLGLPLASPSFSLEKSD